MYPCKPSTLCTWPRNSNMTSKYLPYGQQLLLSSYRMLTLWDLTLPLSVTCPMGSQDHMSQLLSVKSSTCCTPFQSQELDKPKKYYQIILAGIQQTCSQLGSHHSMSAQSKIHRHIISPLYNFAFPDNRFDHLHIDMLGLYLPPVDNPIYLPSSTSLLGG